MAGRKDEGIPLALAAKMLGYSDRTLAGLVKQGKLEEANASPAPESRGRGRPTILIKRSSVEEYARVNYRVIRNVSAEEARGRAGALSSWLRTNTRLLGRVKAARIIEIDGQGERGKVWVRFVISGTNRRKSLTYFWRQDAGQVFGARKFRIEFGREGASVYLRSHDEEEDRVDLVRCVSAAVAAVEREEERIEEGRDKKS